MSAGQIVGVGSLLVGRAPERFRALGVGSCVAVSLWDPDQQLGGLAHVPLPRCGVEGGPPSSFVDAALGQLRSLLVGAGAREDALEAKAAGGASLLRSAAPSQSTPIGLQNVEALYQILEALGIPLVASDLGGESARSVTFDTASGAVEVLCLSDLRRTL